MQTAVAPVRAAVRCADMEEMPDWIRKPVNQAIWQFPVRAL